MEMIKHYFNSPSLLLLLSQKLLTFLLRTLQCVPSPSHWHNCTSITCHWYFSIQMHLNTTGEQWPSPVTKCNSCILTPRVSVPQVPGSRWQWPNLRFSAPLQGAILNPGHGDLCPLSHHHHTAPTLGPLSILLPLKLCMNLISSFM